MCKELELIQTHLGIWKLEDWDINICSTQLNGKSGIYCIKNLTNNKLLIGEGFIGGQKSRPNQHIRGNSSNNIWKKDLEAYGKDNFRLVWIIPEEDEIQRKLIENKLQIHFKDNCYNTPRKEYPSQKQLLESKGGIDCSGKKYKDIKYRLNNYTKIQRNYITECWESKMYLRGEYAIIRFKNRMYGHHILMYILYYGDICGVSSTIHHKCENKHCVNPEHLELVTNKENIRKYFCTDNKTKEINKLYEEGKNSKEIAQYLNIHQGTASKYIDFKTHSVYKGVSWHTIDKCYTCSHQCGKKNTNLGNYNNEIHAAQNRDYYIVKNNLWHREKTTLNFHDIDYNRYVPKAGRNGKINKNLL